jgi:tRNA threonylcarbamoyladenosine biosynthesis protein TsaE
MIIEVKSAQDMHVLGRKIGECFRGGEVVELIGDVGAGKTTLTKGIAEGLGIDDEVQSPTFTISRVYPARDDLILAHYDFYRLNDNAGVMNDELYESVHDKTVITIVEWAKVVEGVMPQERTTIEIVATSETGRRVTITSQDDRFLHELNQKGIR